MTTSGCSGLVGRPSVAGNPFHSRIVSIAASGVGFSSKPIVMQIVWPCSTGTRLVCALTLNVALDDFAVRVRAEQLQHLPLELRLFVGDVRNDVAEDVERRHAGISGAGDGLHRREEELLDPEFLVQAARAPRPRLSTEQLAFVTIAPFQPRFLRCASISAR